MKITMLEFRDMVAEAVRRTIGEAKKKTKVTAPRSEESIAAQRDRQVRALPGYAHGEVLDMSKPLGKKNRAKRQGASGIGNWTSEAFVREDLGPDAVTITWPGSDGQSLSMDVRGNSVQGMIQALVDAGVPQNQIKTTPANSKIEAIQMLVRKIVDEEIRVRRGR
jgi:hypothetical protein